MGKGLQRALVTKDALQAGVEVAGQARKLLTFVPDFFLVIESLFTFATLLSTSFVETYSGPAMLVGTPEPLSFYLFGYALIGMFVFPGLLMLTVVLAGPNSKLEYAIGAVLSVGDLVSLVLIVATDSNVLSLATYSVAIVLSTVATVSNIFAVRSRNLTKPHIQLQ